MIKGYNTQIDVINSYYNGVIDKSEKDDIIKKFKLKKKIVKLLDALNLMFILQKRRVQKVSNIDIEKYKTNLYKIYNVGGDNE